MDRHGYAETPAAKSERSAPRIQCPAAPRPGADHLPKPDPSSVGRSPSGVSGREGAVGESGAEDTCVYAETLAAKFEQVNATAYLGALGSGSIDPPWLSVLVEWQKTPVLDSCRP